MPSRILIVENERSTAEDLQETLTDLGYEVTGIATSTHAAMTLARQRPPDLALLDLRLRGDGDGVLHEHIPMVYLTVHADRDIVQRAKRAKPLGHLVKPFQDADLQASIEIALHHLPQEPAASNGHLSFGSFQVVDESAVMRATLDRVKQVAGSEASAILIEGESGTGKEVIARVLHSLSERHGRPFVPVTCSAIPDNLIESELFGHEEGAFHGALAQKTGLFEIASGGTLFLDEIRDLSPSIQAKILRVVEERSFRRLGSLENIAVDLRVIAATNHRNGQSDDFGTDLFRRAEVVRLGLPSLRERHDDILPLARHFIAQSHSRQTPPVEGISADAAKLLLEHPWPGNVRELRNVIERAVRAEASRQLSPSSIHFVEMPAKKPGTDGDDSPTESERSLVLRALEKSGGNQTRSAKLLGITRDMLRYRMKKMRLRSGTVLDMDATP